MQSSARKFSALFMMVLLVILSHAWGQTHEVQTKFTMTVEEIIQTGGKLIYVLAAMSLVGVAFVLYFFVSLRRRALMPPSFLKDVREMLKEKRFEETLRICKKNSSAVAAITSAGADYTIKVKNPDSALLKEVLEGEGARQASGIMRKIQYLLDIAVISPMVGLLGTVIGMLTTFNVVALDLAKAKPMLLAEGVSKALITTAAGLSVGIPAMVCYAFFRGWAAKVISALEIETVELLHLFTGDENRDNQIKNES